MLSLRLGVFRAVGSSAFRTLVLATVGLLLFSTGSNAQGGEGFVDFQFSFSNPGARSLGFGGAFVALADDATAAYANPAGLVQLIQPEVSVEGRFWSYSTAYTLGGRIDGEPTGIGIDSAVGLRTARSSDDIADLSFVSFVYPGKRWSLALYRHQLANFEFFSQTDALFRAATPPDPPSLTARSLDIRASTDSEIVGWGISGAYRVSDDLSLGLGVIYREGDVSSTVEGPRRRFEASTAVCYRGPIEVFTGSPGRRLGRRANAPVITNRISKLEHAQESQERSVCTNPDCTPTALRGKSRWSWRLPICLWGDGCFSSRCIGRRSGGSCARDPGCRAPR
jgi:hypothetical protein